MLPLALIIKGLKLHLKGCVKFFQNIGIKDITSGFNSPRKGSVIVDNFTFPGYGKTRYKPNIVNIKRISNGRDFLTESLNRDGNIRGNPPALKETGRSNV